MNNAESNFICSPDKKTAVIYSISELGYFLVEIHHQGTSHYIHKKDEPQQFANISLARDAAIGEGAVELYEAIEIIHEAVGDKINHQRFDYHKLF